MITVALAASLYQVLPSLKLLVCDHSSVIVCFDYIVDKDIKYSVCPLLFTPVVSSWRRLLSLVM